MKRPEEPTSADDLHQHGFPDRILPDEAPAAPLATDMPVVVPAHAVPVGRPEPDAASRPVAVEGPETSADARDPGQIGWLERSLFKGRGTRPGSEATSPDPRPNEANRLGGRSETPTDLPRGDAAAEATPVLEPRAGAEPEPTPDLVDEQHAGATVIGRYQAGSAAYVMYSDGTIEVETESGEMHRFGSMDELKAFIAQQDQPVS